MLDDVPPGFAGWSLPVDPFFRQILDRQGFKDVLGRVSERAR
jgi:hypothetical protein